jgi:hypothetical protein
MRRPHDVTRSADDHWLPVLFQLRDEGDMAHEVDIDVEVDLLVREAALEGEEAAIERLVAGPADGGQEAVTILRPQSPDLDRTTVPQGLGGRSLSPAPSCSRPSVRC